MTRAAGLLAFLAALSPAGGFARAQPFSFQAAEFMAEDRARAAAHAWAKAALTPGLPLAEARARAVAAGMTCTPRQADGAVRCRYSMVVHKPGGIIGEDSFVLRLTPDAAGALGPVRLDYQRDGVPD